MTDSLEERTVHFDVVGSIQGEIFQVGHSDITAIPGAKRCRAIATLLFELAWKYENMGEEYEQKMRTLKSELGDVFYEIMDDCFFLAESREQAELLAQEGKDMISYDLLIRLHPNLVPVTE